jgi:hypothetical protein
MTQTINRDLFDKIKGRFRNLSLGKEDGTKTSLPQEAVFFEFDYVSEDKSLGSVVVSLVDEGILKVYFDDKIVENEDNKGKQDWYDFLYELRQFSAINMLNFESKNISKTRLDKKDFEFLKDQYKTEEQLAMESKLYGSKQKSYQDLNGAKLIVKHATTVDEEKMGARSRNIHAIYIENSEGERFKFENNYLPGARAMARHVSNGGYPRDEYGQHISEIMKEMTELKHFVRAVRNQDYVTEEAQDIIERATGRYYGLKSTLESISRQRGYKDYFENYEPTEIAVGEDDITDLKQKLTREVFDAKLESTLGAVGKAMKLTEKKKGEFFDFGKWSRAAKSAGAKIVGNIKSAQAKIGDRVIGDWSQDEEDLTGPKISSDIKEPGYGEINMGQSDRGEEGERGYEVPEKLNLMPGVMPVIKSPDTRTFMAMILSDIAARALDDETSIFAADMSEKISHMGGTFGTKETPEFKENKAKAVELIKKYIAQHKKPQAEESVISTLEQDPFEMYEQKIDEIAPVVAAVGGALARGAAFAAGKAIASKAINAMSSDEDDDEVKEAAKPDYLDLDKDGNKKEPMKQAAKDAKKKKTEEAALAKCESVDEDDRGLDVGMDNEEENPVASAILYRIVRQHPNVFMKYGPEEVMIAAGDVAEMVGDVDEIGSSDISYWTKQTIDMLAGMDESVTEDDKADTLYKKEPMKQMAIYKVFQINLTDAEVDTINAAGDHGAVPKNVLRMKINMSYGKPVGHLVKEAFEKGYYEHVSNITADSLEGVFHIGNVGPEENIERFKPMHSLSVGDVIQDKDGMYHMVASFGFVAVNELNMGAAKDAKKKQDVAEGKMSDIDLHVEEMIVDGASDEDIMAMHPDIVTKEYLKQKRAEVMDRPGEYDESIQWLKQMSGIGSNARSNHGLREGEPGYQITPRSIIARTLRNLSK